MLSKSELVLGVARAMYHSQMPTAADRKTCLISEEEAWNDADEDCREEYLVMAKHAVERVVAHTVPVGFEPPSGTCICLEELHRPSGHPAIGHGVHCQVCGGWIG